jgi:hypothetical protein
MPKAWSDELVIPPMRKTRQNHLNRFHLTRCLRFSLSVKDIGIAMAPDTLYRLASPLIALQFAAVGWRVNREINLGDGGRATWIPIPDLLNIMSLLATVICLIGPRSRVCIDCLVSVYRGCALPPLEQGG